MRWLRRIPRALTAAGRSVLRESVLTDLSFVGGLALTAVGVGMVSVPAGLITGGVEMAGAALMYGRGGES